MLNINWIYNIFWLYNFNKLFFVMIDKEKMLPISVEIFDDKGLFESYEFYNLQVNSTILAEEFTEDYKDYHF